MSDGVVRCGDSFETLRLEAVSERNVMMAVDKKLLKQSRHLSLVLKKFNNTELQKL